MPPSINPDDDSPASNGAAVGIGGVAGRVFEQLRRLRQRVDEVAESKVAAADLNVLAERISAEAGRVRSQLNGVTLPLAHDLHAMQSFAVETLVAAARLCGRGAHEGKGGFLSGFMREGDGVAKALGLLVEAYEISCLAGCSPPYGLWLLAHGLFHAACPSGRSAGDSARRSGAVVAYKRLLAINISQPESLTSSELLQVYRLLDDAACLAEIDVSANEAAPSNFWIDYAQDTPPVPAIRREPPPVEGLGYFSAIPLGQHLSKLLDSLEEAPADDGDNAWDVGLDAVRLSLFRRLRERWAMPPRREQPRRRSQYSVQVCIGLNPIWRRISDPEAAGRLAEWTVQNESPGGFAIMRLTGVTDTLVSGMSIALRKDARQPWAICVIRWVRSETPEQIELGLQLVSNSAIPVRIAFRTGASAAGPVRALVLPPLEAVRRHQAILAPLGTYTSRRFVLLHEGARLYVAQGRLLSLDMQTTSVELFQFEVDPYPI